MISGLLRRIGWLICGACLALTLPATVQAAPTDFEFTVLRNVCTNSGRDFGHGELLLKVRVVENGSSGANKFTLAGVAQHYRSRTGVWREEYTFDTFKVTFPNDGNSYYHKRWFAYDPNDKAKHRLVVVIKVWHNRTVLASKTITGKSC